MKVSVVIEDEATLANAVRRGLHGLIGRKKIKTDTLVALALETVLLNRIKQKIQFKPGDQCTVNFDLTYNDQEIVGLNSIVVEKWTRQQVEAFDQIRINKQALLEAVTRE